MNSRLVATIAVAALLLAGAAELQAARERLFPPADEGTPTMYLRSGEAIRRLAGAYAPLAADVYWIRALQYYGGSKHRLALDEQRQLAPEPPSSIAALRNDYDLLYPLLDITTTLDPLFNIAYRFGAVFLAEPYPSGPGRPDLAVTLLQKGLRARPDKWEYMEDIGFVHYWYAHDYEAAAEWCGRASQVPGAPGWLKSLAATTLAEGGDRGSSRVMWQAIRDSAENEWLRRDAERRLAQLTALDQIDALQRRVDEARARYGQPRGWTDLVRAGALPGVPADPAGVPYDLTADARVRLSRSSPLWPPPEEPKRLDEQPALR
jgi:hypothetical protein